MFRTLNSRAQQLLLDAERPSQLQVRPVIERITDTAGNGLGPFLELLIVRCLARDVSFGYAVGAHRTPFVVIPVQPGLGKVVESIVAGDLIGRKVTMIVVDRHLRRVLVVQGPGCIGLQEKVFG